MNLNKELKLMIYESSLNNEYKEDLLNIVESTDDEEILSEVFDVLEASKEEADDLVKKGKMIREIKHDIAVNGLDDPFYSPDFIKREKNAIKSGKYGSQYDKMSPEEQRRKDILMGAAICRDREYSRGQKKNRGYIDPYLTRRSNLIFNNTKLNQLYTKDAIIDDLKKKYILDDKKMEKLSKIRKKYGHKLESVLEAFNEGILTESEVLELFEASKDEIDYIATQGSFERMNKNTNAMMKNVDKIISGEYKEKKLSEAEKRKRDLKEGYKTLHNDEMYKKLFKNK